LAGLACVSRIYTEHAIFHITERGVVVPETFGMTLEELRLRIGYPFWPHSGDESRKCLRPR
jgi:3-oxoadipate CoA-transferase beta subunit